MDIQNEFRRLHGPVDAVLTLAKREQRKREEREAKRAVMSKVERPIWGKAPGAKARIKQRERREGLGEKEWQARAELREEMVGKWRVEEIIF